MVDEIMDAATVYLIIIFYIIQHFPVRPITVVAFFSITSRATAEQCDPSSCDRQNSSNVSLLPSKGFT